jgi:Tfp pilus assembly PilM family ATPase
MSRFLSSPPADAAIEIAPEWVSIALVSAGGGTTAVRGYAIEPLAPGAVAPSLTSHNLGDRPAVLAALRAAIDRVGVRPRRIALIVPDLVARVSLVRFEQVPARREDLDGLVRWQVRKAAPFPVEEAVLTYVPGITAPGGEREFAVVVARRDIIGEYEGLCDELGMHAGLVDLSTLGLVNLLLASPPVPAGDWLVVHVRPTYVSLVILRGGDVIFFRNVADADVEMLTDLVHQTAMYHQDRLSGAGFSQVLLGGVGRAAGTIDESRRSLEARLAMSVQAVDPRRAAALADRGATPEHLAPLAPAIGTLLRMQGETASV